MEKLRVAVNKKKEIVGEWLADWLPAIIAGCAVLAVLAWLISLLF